MAKDSDKSGDSGSKAPRDSGEAIGLSIEEKGMVVKPVSPDPQGHIDVGGLPSNQGGGEGSGGDSSGGSGDGGSGQGGSSSSDSD